MTKITIWAAGDPRKNRAKIEEAVAKVSRARDSATNQFREKLPGDHPQYKQTVAQPVMAAVDSMPKEYRACVHDYGYVDVYRAWRRGLRPEEIRRSAERNGGKFELDAS